MRNISKYLKEFDHQPTVVWNPTGAQLPEFPASCDDSTCKEAQHALLDQIPMDLRSPYEVLQFAL